MTKRVRRYIRIVARLFIDGADDDLDEQKDDLFDRMTQDERDLANKLVQLVFKEWL